MDKGIYCLVLRNPSCSIRVGALGQCGFHAGFHVYIGSAQGTGGLKRVSRHIALAENRDRHPKWHIDYLLVDRNFDLISVICASTTKKYECRLAQALNGLPVPLFGCSDCGCDSHLFYFPEYPYDQVTGAYQALGLVPVITTIITPNVESNL
jgi:Uri superfamily endonuclease